MLPRFAVDRPVTVLMATLAVCTFGVLAVGRLPVDLLPDLAYPTLTVQTRYPDAARAGDDRGLHEFIVFAAFVGLLQRCQRRFRAVIGSRSHDGRVGLFHPLPALVPVHRVIAAADRCERCPRQ